jgi:SanA protein
MKKKIFKMILRLLIYAGIACVLILGVSRLAIEWYSQPKIYKPANDVTSKVAIVFGAGLTRDGNPTAVLRDRVATAADLFFSGKVEKLLMSGDNRFVYYNEPGAMRDYALKLGVPEDAIVLDYAGRRTYDTCYRAGAIFGVKNAILVTQRFHLARALFTCNNLGVDAIGVTADRGYYTRMTRLSWNLREIPASLVAIWDVLVTHPLPVLGAPEPIFPTVVASKQEQK